MARQHQDLEKTAAVPTVKPAAEATRISNYQEEEKNDNAVVNIVYYTDPLCCWSWGFEPQWRRLQVQYNGMISWRYCMCGLLPDWKYFRDETQLISRPIQMGPVWMEAAHITGMHNRSDIWMRDPPASSYLSCIAVKCAGLQSATAEEIYLRALREAVMLNGQNIGLQSVLTAVAKACALEHPTVLDESQFQVDLLNGQGKEAFQKDLAEVQQLQITRYPSLIFRKEGRQPMILAGYRHYAVVDDIMKQLTPGWEPHPSGLSPFVNKPTPRELTEWAL